MAAGPHAHKGDSSPAFLLGRVASIRVGLHKGFAIHWLGAGVAVLLYSTNPFFAIDVSRRYRKHTFYAWCSEVFSAGQQSGNAPTSLVGASSDPMTIYSQVRHAVESEDRHDQKIKSYKTTFKRLANTWFDKGEITKDQRDEIRASCNQQSWRMWRPFLYVIPRAPLEAAGRLVTVKPHKRASHGPEYIVADLAPNEFDIVELPRSDR